LKRYLFEFVDKLKSKNKFNVDWSEIGGIIDNTLEEVSKRGINFNFNRGSVKYFIRADLELVIYKVQNNECVSVLSSVLCLNDEIENRELFLKLREIKKFLNAEMYRPILEIMFNKGCKGQLCVDVVLMFNILILQAEFNLSDKEVIDFIEDSDFFIWFLEYPAKVLSSSKIESFRNKIVNCDIVEVLWLTHQEYLNESGYPLMDEAAVDASFLDTNQGTFGKPRGNDAKTRRSRDGTFMTKNKEHHFGFKIHQIMDLKYQLIRSFEVTTANVHDSQIVFDLAVKVLYADKGYIGVPFNSYKGYMLRHSNKACVNARRMQRNRRISIKRAPVERPFAFLKAHGQNFTKLTTTPRNKVKILFILILYNTYQLITLKNQKEDKNNDNSVKKETNTNKIMENLANFDTNLTSKNIRYWCAVINNRSMDKTTCINHAFSIKEKKN